MKNLAEYYKPEQEYYLDSITYKRIDQEICKKEVQILCTDTIQIKSVDETGTELTVTRTVTFDPEVLFALSISYGVKLKFIQEKRTEVDWSQVDLAKEFRENGGFVTANLFNRISLLIGEITASFGQAPMIIPPQLMNNT